MKAFSIHKKQIDIVINTAPDLLYKVRIQSLTPHCGGKEDLQHGEDLENHLTANHLRKVHCNNKEEKAKQRFHKAVRTS